MLDQVQQQIAEMVARGDVPGGIIMTPPELLRFRREAEKRGEVYETDTPAHGMHPAITGSGWAFMGRPIFRCWEISGPAVVSRDVLRALRSWEMLF